MLFASKCVSKFVLSLINYKIQCNCCFKIKLYLWCKIKNAIYFESVVTYKIFIIRNVQAPTWVYEQMYVKVNKKKIPCIVYSNI